MSTARIVEQSRRRVVLRPVRDEEEINRVVSWLGQDSRAAALTSDIREGATVASVTEALSRGLALRLVEQPGGSLAGLVTWRARGNPRAYELAVLIADPDLWASGVGADAALQAVDYLFMTLDAQRVAVLTGSFNPYTSPALRRGGFTLEGVLRHHYFVDGEFHDALVWSMLRDEHRAILEAAKGTPLAYRPLIEPEDRARAARHVSMLLADPKLATSWPGGTAPRAKAV